MARKMESQPKPTPTPQPETIVERGLRQLQELYTHLEHVVMGDKYIAWYGQCRAKEMTHDEAMRDTIDYWQLKKQDWYASRLIHAIVMDEPMRDFT